MKTTTEVKVSEYKDDSDIYISVTIHDSKLLEIIEPTVRAAFIVIRQAVDEAIAISKLPKKEDDSIPF